MEEVKTSDSNICDIVIHPPILCEQEVSNEEDDNGVLDQDCRLLEKVEIHDISTESKYCIITDASPRWRKKEHLSLGPHKAPSSSDNIQQHVGKNSFEIFSLFLTPEIIDHITQ